MTLSEELAYRGFVNQTTLQDITELDKKSFTFYFGVDPSADSMQIGNLAAAMMVKHFIKHGHNAVILVGGATGLIGDPDGKSEERQLKTLEFINSNKQKIADQYEVVFEGQDFKLVDNYDWFKDINYLDFLRDVGKHIPMRQMLSREFVQSRLGEDGNGISYAEFSYVLIQAYDFLHLSDSLGVNMQVCGADQWGNSIAGVDLIRRVTGKETHVYSVPLVINPVTGKKFGKSEGGAVWLDPTKTTPTQFYQFWINSDDVGVETFLKIFTMLPRDEIEEIIARHRQAPEKRYAQEKLAREVTILIHGADNTKRAETVTKYITGAKSIDEITDVEVELLKKEINYASASKDTNLANLLAEAGLTSSSTEGRRIVKGRGVYINGKQATNDSLSDYASRYLILRRGKKIEDSALIEVK